VPHGNATADSLLISGGYGEFGGPASDIDDFYVGCTITIIAGNNEGSSRLVTGYHASSRNVTVSPPFSAGCDDRCLYLQASVYMFVYIDIYIYIYIYT